MSAKKNTTETGGVSDAVLKKAFNIIKKSDKYTGKVKLFGNQFIEYWVCGSWDRDGHDKYYLNFTEWAVTDFSKDLDDYVDCDDVLGCIIENQKDPACVAWEKKLVEEAILFEEENPDLSIEVLADIFYNGYENISDFIARYRYLILEEMNKATRAKYEKKIKLNSQYSAVFTKGDDTVIVGCQKIPIKAIKAIVTEWDKLNS